MTTKNWEQEAKGIEEIDFAALADDEKAALPTSIIRICEEQIAAVRARRVLNEARQQDRQGGQQADQAGGRVTEGPTTPDTDGATQVALSKTAGKKGEPPMAQVKLFSVGVRQQSDLSAYNALSAVSRRAHKAYIVEAATAKKAENAVKRFLKDKPEMSVLDAVPAEQLPKVVKVSDALTISQSSTTARVMTVGGRPMIVSHCSHLRGHHPAA